MLSLITCLSLFVPLFPFVLFFSFFSVLSLFLRVVIDFEGYLDVVLRLAPGLVSDLRSLSYLSPDYSSHFCYY